LQELFLDGVKIPGLGEDNYPLVSCFRPNYTGNIGECYLEAGVPMAKKAELERDHKRYMAHRKNMRRAEQDGQYQAALEAAASSLCHIEGMMGYDRKYGKQTQFHSIETIDFLLTYAPLLFDVENLGKVEELIKTRRVIAKNTVVDWTELISSARSALWDAYRLWTLFEEVGFLAKSHLKNEPLLRSIANKWRKIGLTVRKTSESIDGDELTTRLLHKVKGKCPSCGATGTGTKERLLKTITCPRCKTEVQFVWLAE
jgi:hypothetical protein